MHATSNCKNCPPIDFPDSILSLSCRPYQLLHPNLKLGEPVCRLLVFFPRLDVLSQLPGHRFEEAIDLPRFAFHRQLDRSIRQVLHVARDDESMGQTIRRVAKADALHMPLVQDPFTYVHRRPLPYASRPTTVRSLCPVATPSAACPVRSGNSFGQAP